MKTQNRLKSVFTWAWTGQVKATTSLPVTPTADSGRGYIVNRADGLRSFLKSSTHA